jgi:hypothetical protein
MPNVTLTCVFISLGHLFMFLFFISLSLLLFFSYYTPTSLFSSFGVSSSIYFRVFNSFLLLFSLFRGRKVVCMIDLVRVVLREVKDDIGFSPPSSHWSFSLREGWLLFFLVLYLIMYKIFSLLSLILFNVVLS